MIRGSRTISGINKILTVLLILIIVFSSATVYFLFLSPKSVPCSGSTSPSCQHTNYSDECGPPSAIASKYVSEYDVVNEFSSPDGIAVDSGGNAWFVIQNGSELGVLYSSNSSVSTFPIPAPPTNGLFLSYSVVADNQRKLVWFSDDSGANPPSQGIWSFNQLTYRFHFYNLTTAFPYQLFVDKAGNVWFSESEASSIGEIMTNGTISEYKLPASAGQPAGITMDDNGTVWFTSPLSNLIGSLTLKGNSYSFHIYNMTGRVTLPSSIALDSSGNVWLTEHGPSLIAEFNPRTNFFRSISTHIPPVLGGSYNFFLYIDARGNVWFNEHEGNAIARFSPSNDTLVEYLIPTQIPSECNISGAETMNLSPNGTPWFTEWFAGKIGTVHLQTPINVAFSIQSSSDAKDSFTLANGQSVNISLDIITNNSTSLAIYLALLC